MMNTRRLRVFIVNALVLIALSLGAPNKSFAALVLQAESVTVTSPGTSFFDVFAVIDDTLLRNIGGYQTQLDLSPTTFSLTLNSAEEALTNPLFPGQNPLEFATGNSLQVSDFLPGINEALPLHDGDRLFRVLLNIPSGVPVGTVFNVNFNPLVTELVDGFGAAVAVDGFVSGSITVVPEPAAWALMGIASMVLAWGELRRRSAARLIEV